jgi:thymidylate synthase
MNKLDLDYQNILKDILENGTKKETRNGGTLSVFGRQIRHKMSDGFPLLTTKKMPFKTIVTELLWFLRGDTNIKYLVDNNCHIWDGDCFSNYVRNFTKYVDSLPEHSETEFIIDKDKFINKIKTDTEFAKTWGDLGPVYGAGWRNWKFTDKFTNGEQIAYVNGKIDQIANLINDLKTNPDSRRIMVTAWNVGELDQMTLPPCHYGFQVYTRELSARERTALKSNGRTRLYDSIKEENYQTVDADDVMHTVCDEYNVPKRAISLMWNQRSVDTFLGLPFNIASYGLLLEIIAKSVNMVPDELIGNLGDTHLYANHVEQAREQIGREPFPLPTLNINTEWWPTEGGECGVGPIDATSVFDNFTDDNFCRCLLEADLQLANYQSHTTIKAPLSN